MHWWRTLLKELIITGIGLVFGSLLIPYIFAEIQNSQKELEIKTGLIKEMNPAIMDSIMVVQVLE
jgi:hypothetical protein